MLVIDWNKEKEILNNRVAIYLQRCHISALILIKRLCLPQSFNAAEEQNKRSWIQRFVLLKQTIFIFKQL